MSILNWDAVGERYFETGVDHGVLYVQEGATYPKGVVWNGLTSVNESPEGAEANEIWADNMLYAVLRSAERFKMTIEAYQSPVEFDACDGSASVTGLAGVRVGQQARKAFGFAYRTKIGDDTDPNATAYKIHIVYGCTADPSDRDHETINDSPDGETLSWEVSSVPVPVTGFDNPTSTMTFDSRETSEAVMAKLEEILYGTESTEAYLPLPDALIALLKAVG